MATQEERKIISIKKDLVKIEDWLTKNTTQLMKWVDMVQKKGYLLEFNKYFEEFNKTRIYTYKESKKDSVFSAFKEYIWEDWRKSNDSAKTKQEQTIADRIYSIHGKIEDMGDKYNTKVALTNNLKTLDPTFKEDAKIDLPKEAVLSVSEPKIKEAFKGLNKMFKQDEGSGRLPFKYQKSYAYVVYQKGQQFFAVESSDLRDFDRLKDVKVWLTPDDFERIYAKIEEFYRFKPTKKDFLSVTREYMKTVEARKKTELEEREFSNKIKNISPQALKILDDWLNNWGKQYYAMICQAFDDLQYKKKTGKYSKELEELGRAVKYDISNPKVKQYINKQQNLAKRALINEVVEKGGAIKGIDYLRIEAGQLNGQFVCAKGIVRTQTIYAGGYNIQALHVRHLVNLL